MDMKIKKDAVNTMIAEIDRFSHDLIELKVEIENSSYMYSSTKRSAVKRGVIDLKYRLTQLVKKLY